MKTRFNKGALPHDCRTMDLMDMDLRCENFVNRELAHAHLDGSDLECADFTHAKVWGASGPFSTCSFGLHFAIAVGGNIYIGCEKGSYDWWLQNYEKVGVSRGYTPEQIEIYGKWIKMVVPYQERIEEEIRQKRLEEGVRVG